MRLIEDTDRSIRLLAISSVSRLSSRSLRSSRPSRRLRAVWDGSAVIELPPVTRASFCVTERCSAYESPQSANLRGSGTALGLSGRGEARLGWDNGPHSPYSADILHVSRHRPWSAASR